ncbi:MAG: 4Fe-4S dicluster domain-containing protein [Clostridiales bacterium]|nr:4Fe-4S dicluster domain-containing protein [Clostridiales bacterium]
MSMITLTIDNMLVEVPQGTTVLEAARQINVRIPTLCFLKEINEIGACRMCVVDAGGRTLQPACVLEAAGGMVVKTNTPRVREARKVILELILSNHDKKCLSCTRNQNCELQRLSLEMGVTDENEFAGLRNEYLVDDFSPSIVRDNNKCILCRRCVSVCYQTQAVGAIGPVNRGFNTAIESPWQMSLTASTCIACGQCIAVCPVGALREKEESSLVYDFLADPAKHVVVQPAPAVRAALGEEFGLPMGTNVSGKLAASLRRLGFDRVFDTEFGADLTIMEESTELIGRIQNGGVLPMITSCSPGWINYCETFYPEFIPNLSSCKSPHEMTGAMVKTYYAMKMGIDPKDIAVVSVMPCTAKKFEADREELSVKGLMDVDAVITTRELARMIKQAGIDFVHLADEKFDELLGESTGAAGIFGATGGVMEAALRTAYETLTGQELASLDFENVRGIQGVKEAAIAIGDLTLKVAVANGTANAKELLERVKSGEKEYHFIEVMGCPGGCVTGGGQPIVSDWDKMNIDPRVERAKALYSADREAPLRRSHLNSEVLRAYRDFLGEPNSHKAHELLHTSYSAKPKYKHSLAE